MNSLSFFSARLACQTTNLSLWNSLAVKSKLLWEMEQLLTETPKDISETSSANDATITDGVFHDSDIGDIPIFSHNVAVHLAQGLPQE
jgi:hypothetical protein